MHRIRSAEGTDWATRTSGPTTWLVHAGRWRRAPPRCTPCPRRLHRHGGSGRTTTANTSVRDVRRSIVQTGPGMPQVDANNEWSPLDDLVALHLAEGAGELHRRLLCFGDWGGNKSDAFEPWCLFHRHHADVPDGAVVTALLLLTDRRWRNATSRLVRRIEGSGLVPDDQLDLLAQTFLAAGPHVYWEAPADWFHGPTILLDPEGHDVVDGDHDEDLDESDDGPVVFAREIRPPLLRWAAARALRSDPGCWGSLVKRAREVDPRRGAAMMFGIVDGINLLAPAARGFVLDLAEHWPHRKLREAATALRQPPGPAPGTRATAAAQEEKQTRSAPQPSLF